MSTPYRQADQQEPWTPCWGLHIAGVDANGKAWSEVSWFQQYDPAVWPIIDYGVVQAAQARHRNIYGARATVTFFAPVWLSEAP